MFGVVQGLLRLGMRAAMRAEAAAALAAALLALALPACEGLLPGAALPRLARPFHSRSSPGCALGVGTAGARRAPRARTAAAARGILALRCQQEDGGQTGWRQGSIKGPDPLAPYCTETQAKPTGELYESGDGTQVLQLEDGSVVLERPDGVQVTRVECSGFYCIDVEYFQQPGTESNLNTLITTVKVIVGGVAPLLMPWCIKNQGIVGGPLTVLGVGLLSQLTIKQLVEYRDAVVVETGRDDLTYVDVARHAFGDLAANSVFFMTIVNSLGVCAAYSTFIGSTMATLSSTPGNIVFDLARDISSNSWQVAAASLVLPLNALAGSPTFLSSVALLGASALFVGVATTCWYGFSVTPDFVGNLAALPWFTSPQEYFTSFGVVPLLFCVHFAVLSIERNMKNRADFPSVLSR